VRSGSDNAYGIYLTQMLFISWLSWHGWVHLDRVVPWPLVCLLTVPIVFVCGIALTSLLARTPLAVPLTGRPRQPWSTLLPPRWRAAAARPGPDAAAVTASASDRATDRAANLAEPAPGALAGLMSEGNRA
jgi:hypothetical protein